MPNPQIDVNNANFQLAADYIIQTNTSVFLTGKAGTGKTTFLKYIKESASKNMVIVAPTGVASINAGGVTIHSFFQLPLSPFVPEVNALNNSEINNKHNLLKRIRFNSEKRDLLQQLELLVVDEISMVRCDTLDAIDVVLRSFRNKHHEPFGGVQLLLIGDMFQLPPVIQDNEWNILSQFYSNQYFFSSKALQQLNYVYVELNKIYRQSDDVFINVLNQVRNNELDEDGLQILHQQYNPSFTTKANDGYIILTTHNYKADAINTSELNKLKTPLIISQAVIDGEFYERSFPAEESLQLKIGAQVMFIKNDKEKVKRFYNGKIGTVTKIDKETVFIQCKNETMPVELKQETWRNIRYQFNKQTNQIHEEEIGSFTQFPLRLAWAITIHKSQGLTFDKAVIDTGAAFAPGQVYVALSRCTNLQGIVLLSKINNQHQADERVVDFIKMIKNNVLHQNLSSSKHVYQQKLLKELFNFDNIIKQNKSLIKIVADHETSFNKEAMDWLQSIKENIDVINATLEKFQPQFQQLLQQQSLPEENEALQKRLMAASKYFADNLQLVANNLYQSNAITDSKQHANEYNEALKDLFNLINQKINLLFSLNDGFSVNNYYQFKKNYQAKPFTINAYAGVTHKQIDSPHPELYKQLRLLRDEISKQNNMPIYLIAGSATIDEMARFLPQTNEELLLITGFGKAKTERFGKQFLDIINDYAVANNLSSLTHEIKPKHSRREKKKEENQTSKPDTKLLTYELYKSGKTIKEISIERNLTTQTIEGHLAHFVEKRMLNVDELVSREKFVLIEPVVRNNEFTTLTPIKEQLGNDISYGEIKLVMAAIASEKSVD